MEITRRDVLFAVLAALAWVALARPGPIDLPYFWDEADVYVPGARWLAEHGLDVTPGTFPDDYSRGHPPLFYLLAALAFRIFGADPGIGHLVVLPFTVLAIAATYLLGVAMFDRLSGFAAAAVLATTPLFLSIGNMMLPEVPLTALTALALFFLARGKILPAVLLGVALVWIKETGIFSAGAIGIGVLATRAPKKIALATIPLFALLAFFAWQRATAGYFVFPHHQGLFADRPFALENVFTVVPSIALWHGRWLVVIGAILAFRRPRLDPATIACLALVVLNAIFFSKMFWLERYALPAHPGLLVVACGLLLRDLDARSIPNALLAFVPIAVACGWAAGSLHAPAPRDSEEHTFAYADVIATHREAFAALRSEDEPVLTTWPLDVELEEPYLGYVRRPFSTVNVRYDRGAGVGSVLVSTASPRADELRQRALADGMFLRARFQRGTAPAIELWR